MEPLPPVKEVEYRCIIGKIFEELSGAEYITFAFETAKEFSSFRYEIAVRYRIQPGSLEFKVLGMTATRTMMPAHGTARSVLKVPLLPPGIYAVKMIKSDGTENVFSLEVNKRGLQIMAPVPRKRFIDLVIDPKASLGGAKITSTVSKAPPAPLIPRTIQKRQPPPPTPEELALLESLKTETPEERDAREEMELFGGKKKVDKKDLEEVEQDLKKLGDTPPAAAVPMKSGAKTPIEEVKEVPATAMKASKTPEKHAAKPAEASHEKSHADKAHADKAHADKSHGEKAKSKPEPSKPPVKSEAGHKPAPKAETKPDPKTNHASGKVAAKPMAKADAKPEPAKSSKDAKPASKAKSAPARATKSASTTVAKAAAKPAAKSAAAKHVAAKQSSAKKPIAKSAPTRTGTAKTTKHPAKKAAPAAKKR